MEAYSPVAADWTPLAPMPQVRCGQHRYRRSAGNCLPACLRACMHAGIRSVCLPAHVLPYSMPRQPVQSANVSHLCPLQGRGDNALVTLPDNRMMVLGGETTVDGRTQV